MRLSRRIGRRGAALLFFALLDFVYGYSLVAATARSAPLFVYLRRLMPLGAWGTVWIVVGVVLLVSAPLADDRIAFAVASFWKLLWGVLNLAAWGEGVPRAYVSAVIWIAFAGFVQVISGWPEPAPVSFMPDTDIGGPDDC